MDSFFFNFFSLSPKTCKPDINGILSLFRSFVRGFKSLFSAHFVRPLVKEEDPIHPAMHVSDSDTKAFSDFFVSSKPLNELKRKMCFFASKVVNSSKQKCRRKTKLYYSIQKATICLVFNFLRNIFSTTFFYLTHEIDLAANYRQNLKIVGIIVAVIKSE